jgi:hypothetical protein
MKFPLRKLLMALVFGFGAIATPAALVLIEAANAPQPEMRDPAYVRTLLAQGRLVWEDQQATAGGSALRGYNTPEPGSGD